MTDGQISYAVLNYDTVWSNIEYAGRPLVSQSYSGATEGIKKRNSIGNYSK